MPYCHIPCPYLTWGPGCINKCNCPNTTTGVCTCDPVTGECRTCDPRYDRHYYPVKEPKCLEEHKMLGKEFEYVPPSVLDFPYKPILAVGSTVALFVFGNFLWWYFIVRTPKPKETEKQPVRRAKKPPKVKTAKLARYRKALQDYAKEPPKPHRFYSTRSRSYSVDDGTAETDDN
ncbi:hypothetical protein BsWGS_23950 [Bradybaena similaris]